MQRYRIVGRGSLVSSVIVGLMSPLTMTGCESRSESPVAQASAGQAGAKSSMDYMRKHVAEKKSSKGKAKGH